MAQATFKIGERVLCYETDPGKVNKLYQAVVNQVDQQQKTFLVHFCGWGHRWDRRVERAFLLKDSEINQRLMKQINSQAEKKKGVRIKEKVGLEEEQNKLRGGKNLRNGMKMKGELGLKEEKHNKLKGALKLKKVPKCGLKVETGMSKVRKRETGVAELEQVSKTRSSRLRSFQPSGGGVPSKWEEKRSFRLRRSFQSSESGVPSKSQEGRSSRLRNCKEKRRSRSGLWEANKEMTPRKSKLLHGDTVARVWNMKKKWEEMGLPADNLAKVERMLGSQKEARGKLRNGSKHRWGNEISAQGSVPSASKIGLKGESVKQTSRWKMKPNTCAVCSAVATSRHYSSWACYACASFFRKSVISNETYRPCKAGGKCNTEGTNRRKCQSCRLLNCQEVGMDVKCVQERKPTTDATIVVPRRTRSRQHMLTGRKKAKGEGKAEPASQKVDLRGVKSKGSGDTAEARMALGGRKRAMSEAVAEAGQSKDAAGVRNATVTEEYSRGLIDQALKVPEAEELEISGECRPFKRRKSDRMTSIVKSVAAREETNQSEVEVDVEEVEAEEVSKFNIATTKEGGNVEEAAVRQQPIKWKLELSPSLKKILERDHKMVMKKGKRHRLPASPNIIRLLSQFVKDASLRRLSVLEKLESKLDNLRVGKRRASKQISEAEEELDNQLQMAEATIVPLRELSDALQTIADQRLEKSVLYPGEAAHPGTITPPAQPTTYHTITEGLLTVDSLRQSILAWSPTPAPSNEGPPSSLVYGGVHLLRMLVRLPQIFAQMDFQHEDAALFKSLFASLQEYFGDIAGQFVKKDQYQ